MEGTSNEQWLARLKAVECSDSTYPAQDPALVFARAAGCQVWDVEGRAYLDLCAGFGALALGHHPKELADLWPRACDEPQPIVHGLGDVYASVDKVELLETLAGLVPGLSRVALAISGSQAVELAVKTAMLATKRAGFICFDDGYHGVDLGLLALSAREDFREPFAEWIGSQAVRRLPYGCSADALAEAIRELAASPAGFAGILVEPIQGRGGVQMPPAGWLATMADQAHSAGGLLIYDEVFVGLGRTGRMSFAEEYPADLVCWGKALGGGLPLSACVGTPEAFAAWPESRGEAIHTGTFFGHPQACRLANGTLAQLRRDDLLNQVRELGAWWQDELRKALPVVEVRGSGLMLGLDTKQAGCGATWMDNLRREGVIALASGPEGNCLNLTPPLTISRSEIETATAKICATLPR